MRRDVFCGPRRYIICGIAARRKRVRPEARTFAWTSRAVWLALAIGFMFILRYSPIVPIDPARNTTVVAHYTVDDFANALR